ncbi:EAL domain-containing protein [Magnetospirillum sp. SS-4]|uniref:EAL domain-containing protein n=1 Tax=Magnetospirillum sp. SS-4 TaxID=2681465 RepID=UPI00137FEFB3|nr:EAL domain-containing protein [Magnetospirillum sp. SS-4]CAA7623349.1 Predicted signal transduction protein containing a membrane domain [Magnetospirillum sp. SS-4]
MKKPPGQDRNQGASGEARIGRPQEAYVAFAFAAADLLMETDHSGRIIFAVGASMSLVGRPARLLATMTLEQLIRPEDMARTRNALRRMARGERVRHTLLHVAVPDGDIVPVALSGYPHPDHEGRLLLVLTHGGTIMTPTVKRNDEGLLGREGFEALAGGLIKESAKDSDDSYRMTLLDLPELAGLRAKVGAEATAGFIARFTDYLRQCSVGGEAAADLGDSKYGLIHGPDLSAGQIETAISGLAQSILGADLHPDAATISFDGGEISPQEATNALVYTLNRFAQDGSATIQDLSRMARPTLSLTVTKMREIKQTIGRGDFQLHFQPIVDLWSGAVHHFECLVRFGDSGASPYNTVVFAEDTGLVGELDCAILARAIAFMRQDPGAEPSLRFAVNLSGRSLSSSSVAARLVRMISEASDLRGRLLFELTESAAISDLVAANAIIQEIRGRGHPVGIDDFGSGAAAFHYLRGLKVDHVKIDGSYVREAASKPESLPFLRAITQLCRELKVATIAEQVEDEATANLLRVYNVRYGQGYYFGRPMQPSSRHQGGRAPWVTPLTQWRNGLLFFGAPQAGASTPSIGVS